ncbi:molybdopterin-dependent oxidoreductase [Actinomadura barringtoniae]|uniref:Molybdopterin-dependent oxidoreductase n=1 Tax=Actinomadura barringtoniae TaxID=1427535 RepID=A0A939T6C4_9ACTN|nr:molybdopterin-dependent oxidoreductase [Actinomadura barringtoniae]MBO2451763.1 molybdopterin-dependent oxidoreductase [Actinomadura barringtoniae]
MNDYDEPEVGGPPVGRRIVLGMLGLGAAGVVVGASVQRQVNRTLAPVRGLEGVLPAAGGGFRFYSVTGGVKKPDPQTFRITVKGMVREPRSFGMADLAKLPQTRMTRDFQCVTGWRVPDVGWAGVALPDLLEAVGVGEGAKAIRFTSFDGVYTESLTMDQARRRDVLVATEMLGGPVTHDHGGPVRLYVAPMYGYKSLKWLGGIEVVDRVRSGYWERRGYDVDAWVGRSNGRDDEPT